MPLDPRPSVTHTGTSHAPYPVQLISQMRKISCTGSGVVPPLAVSLNSVPRDKISLPLLKCIPCRRCCSLEVVGGSVLSRSLVYCPSFSC